MVMLANLICEWHGYISIKHCVFPKSKMSDNNKCAPSAIVNVIIKYRNVSGKHSVSMP